MLVFGGVYVSQVELIVSWRFMLKFGWSTVAIFEITGVYEWIFVLFRHFGTLKNLWVLSSVSFFDPLKNILL